MYKFVQDAVGVFGRKNAGSTLNYPEDLSSHNNPDAYLRGLLDKKIVEEQPDPPAGTYFTSVEQVMEKKVLVPEPTAPNKKAKRGTIESKT